MFSVRSKRGYRGDAQELTNRLESHCDPERGEGEAFDRHGAPLGLLRRKGSS